MKIVRLFEQVRGTPSIASKRFVSRRLTDTNPSNTADTTPDASDSMITCVLRNHSSSNSPVKLPVVELQDYICHVTINNDGAFTHTVIIMLPSRVLASAPAYINSGGCCGIHMVPGKTRKPGRNMGTHTGGAIEYCQVPHPDGGRLFPSCTTRSSRNQSAPRYQTLNRHSELA